MKGTIAKLAIIIFLANFQTARAEILTLEDAHLRVDLDGKTGLFQATEKASGTVWRQTSPEPAFTVDSAKRVDSALELQLNGLLAMKVKLSLSPQSDLLVTLEADPEAQIEDIAYPDPLNTPKGANIVFTDSEGILIPADKPFVIKENQTFPFYNHSLIMSWIGVVDADLKQGYVIIADTPADGAIRMLKTDGRLAPTPVWLSEKGKFGYTRKMLYHFFDQGGYVAQAKRYREYLKGNRPFATLKERQAKRPAIADLIGAVHIYTWDDGRTVELAHELKNSGIEKAWIGWDPSHTPYPKEGYDQGLKKLGYVSGVYDLYRAMYDDRIFGERMKTDPRLKGMWLYRFFYPGLFPEAILMDKQGEMVKVKENNPLFNLPTYYICDTAIQPHLGDRMNKELKVYPHNSVFLDVTLAAPPYECYNPGHPLTRRQDMEERVKLPQFFGDKYHMVVGSEWGTDYGTLYTDFFHGLVTMGRFGWANASNDPKSPYYGGDWLNFERPTMVLGEQKPTKEYLEYGLGEKWRVPLHELVFHDCAVSSWRWNDNTHKQPETWDQKTLFETLYGTAPQWNLDRAMWEKYKDKFVATYKKQGPWLQAIGYDEMLDHRFLTKDREVQETTFASGAKAIVNFGKKPYTDGKIHVAPRDSLLIVPAH